MKRYMYFYILYHIFGDTLSQVRVLQVWAATYLQQICILSSRMYCQNNYRCTCTQYFYFERFSIHSMDRYHDMIFARSAMYLLCDHCSFESSACQFIRNYGLSCDVRTFLRRFCAPNIPKSYFYWNFWKKAMHFCITSEKKLVPMNINHTHARCYIKRALARRHCFGVVTAR